MMAKGNAKMVWLKVTSDKYFFMVEEEAVEGILKKLVIDFTDNDKCEHKQYGNGAEQHPDYSRC